MLFERIVSEGIAHNSYLIGSGGRAAVIDPRRDCDIYLEIARRNELVITHIFETHRNEDYTVGSVELQQRCEAEIFHGAKMAFAYGKPVYEGDRFTVGSLVVSVLETPGHTEESISLVVQDTDVSDQPYMVFSGDTLFAGDIARTDFYGQERKAEMAKKIYESIVQKILPLGDGVILCPAHGAGSICGGEIADYPFTTLGYEKKTNPQLASG
ncbi:MAG: MBL fold metallo-hydrolase, partial [Methanoregula sp.]|nr:MBL fold metallo-hydrolase [Methanoregula sp.]